MVHCDFCGYDFDPGCAEQSCQGCPLVKTCGKVICPRCGYEMLPEAKLVVWVRELLNRKRVKQDVGVEGNSK
ncbi:MAG: hypothetical protein M1281_09155 [Chloroflexi bacterium]|nr:hypothetical protein [Chloroflexota bacterium]